MNIKIKDLLDKNNVLVQIKNSEFIAVWDGDKPIKNKKYDAVLVMDIDRLGRGDMQDQGLILDTFKSVEHLIPVSLPRELTTFNTFLCIPFLFSFNSIL